MVTEGPVFQETNTYNYDAPAFQILGEVDVRPIRQLSLSPYYGVRDGMLVLGGAVRIHFTR
jgi:hypothetical protein